MPATEYSKVQTAAGTLRLPRQYLYGSVLDFLLLGGGSLFALLLIRLYLGGADSAKITSLTATLALANLINHPHFAHSYQIFYSNFRRKLSSSEYPPELRNRYLLVGIVAPLAIAAYLVWTIWSGQPRMLGLAASAMFFLVGWHYVKQGYGMAMADAVLKRAFYSEREKKLLLWNSYATWILSWLLINYLLKSTTKDYFGIEYFVVPVPAALVWLGGATSITTTAMLVRELIGRKTAPAWNGLIAYGVSLYAWLLIRDPVVLLWVPLFHSLQYLAVVWRFQSNKSRSSSATFFGRELGYGTRMFVFVVGGALLGYAGFWLLPEWLSVNVPYDETLFGGGLFFFLFWIFINIHHYLLDTVMWRKGNPDVARHLFGAGK